MKFILISALAALAGVGAAESMSTITCSGGCPSHSTTPDIVTRSPVPTSSCTEPHLTVVTHSAEHSTPVDGGNATHIITPSGTPSDVPAGGADGVKVGGVGAMVAFAAVGVAYLL